MINNKKRFKPFYKQFISLRTNIQTRAKLFKFRKQKWKNFQTYHLKQLKFFRRYKIKDQFSLIAKRFASRGNSYKKRFKVNLQNRKIFSLFYGKLGKKYLKNKINRVKKTNQNSLKFQDYRRKILKFFESRLDAILYRSKFSYSVKNARQLILHGHILVNNKIVKTSSYIVKNNDLISIKMSKKTVEIIRNNVDRSNFWPVPPDNLCINYNILQIMVCLDNKKLIYPNFSHSIKINSVISNINRF